MCRGRSFEERCSTFPTPNCLSGTMWSCSTLRGLYFLFAALTSLSMLRKDGVLFVRARIGNRPPIVLFPDGAPGEVSDWPGPEKNITGDDGVLRVYNVSVPTLTMYPSPSAPNQNAPALIIAPGGGYTLLAINKEGTDVAARFNEFGIHAFVLKYRVPARPAREDLTKWWAPLQDVQRAMGYVRHNAKALGVNPRAIGLAGFSAGGHLTGHLSSLGNWSQRLYDPVDESDLESCRPDFSLLIYPWSVVDGNAPTSTTLSPELRNMSKASPPSFLTHAADDQTAPFANSVVFFEALHRVGFTGPTRLEIDPSGGHGFGLCQDIDPDSQVCAWPSAAAKFISDVLSAK